MSGDRRGGGAARARNASVAHGFSRAFACEGKAIARLKVCVVLLVAAPPHPQMATHEFATVQAGRRPVALCPHNSRLRRAIFGMMMLNS